MRARAGLTTGRVAQIGLSPQNYLGGVPLWQEAVGNSCQCSAAMFQWVEHNPK